MAWKGSPEKSKPLVGFVHKLSPMKTGQKSEWCDLDLQLKDKHVKTLCFSKKKRDILLENQNNLTAVKLSNYIPGKSKLDNTEDVIKVNDQTTIEKASASEYNFQYVPDEEVKITNLADLQKVQFGKMVNLKGKICKGETGDSW